MSKERPILFSGTMVRALLEGRKTQTRRIIKHGGLFPSEMTLALAVEKGCPYGQPGDRLWVREAHWWFKDEHDPVTGYFPPKLTAEDVEYRADGDDGRKVWRPSIHMPRWASRILLEITGVRVERLHDISADDSRAEGAVGHPDGPWHAYRSLWTLINGPDSWEANPWVWVVEFSVATQAKEQ